MESDSFKLVLDPKSEVLLQTQIYLQLRQLVLRGELMPGIRLPPSRKLADMLGVSRKTVVRAYDQLLAEGYVTSQTGSGTFVSDPSNAKQADESTKVRATVHTGTALESEKKRQKNSSRQSSSRQSSRKARRTSPSRSAREPVFRSTQPEPRSRRELETGDDATITSKFFDLTARTNETDKVTHADQTKHGFYSDYARRLSHTEMQTSRIEHMRFPFFNWQPAFDEIPFTEWARIVAKTFRRTEAQLVDYAADPLGHLPLRRAIADRLVRTRGLDCRPEQIVITCGLSQSLDLIARLHADEGMELLVENPSYKPVRDVFRTYGAQIRSIDVDQGGMKTARLAKLSKHNIKCIYVTPSHQFPTGAVLSLARRLELLKWATEYGALIIEDDFDSEFRYRGSPIPAMKSLDTEEQVIYLSSFTKIFYPSLAIAFMVLPHRLVPIYTKARSFAADQVSLQLQEALAEFISAGYLERHVRKMRTTYALRRKALLESIEDHLEGIATTHGDHAGLSTLLRLRCDLEDDEILERANQRGIALTSTRSSYTRNAIRGEFILGYGNLRESEIRKGIMELRLIVKGK